MNQARLYISPSSTGLVILYKKYEHFKAITIDETIMIDDVAVIDEKIVGYESDGSFSHCLPDPADMTLTFYGIADTKFKTNTMWDNLELDEYIKFTKDNQDGAIITDNTINYRTKPDAIFELELTDANVSSETETIFQFTTTII